MCVAEIQLCCLIIENCVISIQDWCASICLQLNPDKTEKIIWFGSKSNTAKLHKKYISLRLESVVTNPSATVRNFGVKTGQRADHEFIYCQNSIVMFYHLHRLWKLRRLADQPAMQRLVSAFVIARMDYSNSLLAVLPLFTLAFLQHVLSAAVHLAAGLGPCDHVTERVKRLHWLTITYRINLNYVFLCMVLFTDRVLFTSRTFSFQYRFF